MVTGASSGIGAAITRRLLDDGWQVIGVARDPRRAPFTSPHYQGLALDLADLPRLEERLRDLPAELPPLDALVLCAGRGWLGGLEEMSFRQIRELIELNVTSQILMARALWPELKRQGGDLIFLGSEAALAGRREGAVYCASKFALRGFAQALREEGARSGIRVAIVNPGMVKTPFFATLDIEPGPEPANYLLPEDVAAAVALILDSQGMAVVDEINLSPLKKVVRKKKGPRSGD